LTGSFFGQKFLFSKAPFLGGIRTKLGTFFTERLVTLVVGNPHRHFDFTETPVIQKNALSSF
jgi:hypothetical protein